MGINYLKLNIGDIVEVKDSVIGTKLKVIDKFENRFVRLVDLKEVIVITIEVVEKIYKEGR
jgi:hypothetical protein